MRDPFRATAAIKLVIWDLDDTFWAGTISEGEIELSARNIEIVKTLTDRGIMSSIASKNDFEPVKKVLTEAGIWDYFIFPQISWNPKGGAISTIVEQANLRPDNVLFIDDNSLNIEEIRFRFPTMMVADPQDVLPSLLDLEQAKGKDDRQHSRLKQYKQLEKKVAEQASTTLSNEDFLRQCDARLRFDFEVDKHLPRIVELINRTNQLNYTKVRLESEAAISEFKELLNRHDIVAGCIFASDRYGDHGLIGFYMQHKNERVNRLIHYVWSCRMMNAGLEQYVYERLGKPDITIVEPVSNPISVFEKVDWIREISEGEQIDQAKDAPRLLLIGSCDLTAVASYCSPNRIEFVNGVKNGIMTRYDDLAFILGDSEKIEASTSLAKIPAWDKDDFRSFRENLSSSDMLIVSLSAAMKGAYLITDDDVALRIHPEGLGDYIDVNPWADFLKGHKIYGLDSDQKFSLLRQSLELVDALSAKAKHKFLLGANTRNVEGSEARVNLELLSRYNDECRRFCAATANWHFVSIDDVVAAEKLLDDRHYTRMGYFDIAQHINHQIAAAEPTNVMRDSTASTAELHIADIIRSGGRELSRFHLFGSRQGLVSHAKRAVKLTPFSSIARKLFTKPKAEDPLAA
jgi:FkbH-like protein